MLLAVLHQGVDFTSIKIDLTDMFIFAGIILAAIGACWAIARLIVLGIGSATGWDMRE